MKPDIKNRRDIENVVHLFYQKIKSDKLLSHYFTEVVPVNWEKHLPLMCSFWENVLFFTGEYSGNPLVTHQEVNAKHTTANEDFKRWLKLFKQTIDAHYKGENAKRMKDHARKIAEVMQSRIK